MKLQHHIPKISQRLLPPEILDLDFPFEHRSNCKSCYEAASGKYEADLKCCTVIPHVPNFLLGMGLKDRETQKQIEHVIRLGFVLPEGMQHTPQLFFRSMTMNREGNFGRDYDMVCPFLRSDKSQTFCGIHAYRNANCSTFFCQSNLGADGSDLWMDVRDLMRYGETHLSGLCLEAIAFDFHDYLQRLEDIAVIDPKYTLDAGTRGFSLAAMRYIWGFDEEFTALTASEEKALGPETQSKIVTALKSMSDWLMTHDDWTSLISASTFERPNLTEFSEEPDYSDDNAGRYINFEEAKELLIKSQKDFTPSLAKANQFQTIRLAQGYAIEPHKTSESGIWHYKIATDHREDITLLDQDEHDLLTALINGDKSVTELETKHREWLSLMVRERIVEAAPS